MVLRDTDSPEHEEAANAARLHEFAAARQADAPNDEFGRWLEMQSALFRGKRPGGQVPALLNPALLNP